MAKQERGALRRRAESPEETPREAGYRMPAEWHPHAATWLAWPFHRTDWPGKKGAIPWVFAEIARQLQEGERVRLLVRSADEQARAEKVLARAGVSLARVDFVRAATNRSWTRDSLPLFVVAAPGAPLGAVKFRFNGWARYRDHALDDAAGELVARRFAARRWFPVDAGGRRVVFEGGALDVDGEGTLLATEECLLTGRFARNRELGREGTEAVLRDALGIERVLWLGSGIAGDDTSGHVDDFVRFVRPGVVVLATEPHAADPNHRPLAACREQLEGQRDAQGRRLELVALPMPSAIHYGGLRLPASYANFYVGNEVVLVPTFNDVADREALGILAELFPDRRVVGIHAVDLVLGLGTLHCSTQQEPAP